MLTAVTARIPNDIHINPFSRKSNAWGNDTYHPLALQKKTKSWRNPSLITPPQKPRGLPATLPSQVLETFLGCCWGFGGKKKCVPQCNV